MTQETLLMIGIGVVALIVGYFIGKSTGASDSSNKVAAKAEKELEAYKASVSQHFGETADLIDNLTESYKNVFEHLGTSAKSLLTEEEVNKHISSRADKAITLTYDADADKKTSEEKAQKSEENNVENHSGDVEETVTEEAKKMAESMAENSTKKTDQPKESETDTNKS